MLFVLAAVAALCLASAGHAADMTPGKARVILPAARDINAPGGLPLRQLLDIPMRDPNITLGPDGNYYLVGTTDPAPGYTTIGAKDPSSQMWTVNDGIRMWKSPDLVHWQALGLIWSLDKDGAWAHWWTGPNPGSAVWAPEIHYLKGTYWIPYCTKLKGEGLHLGAGLLRSASGKPEGPYRDVQPSGPLGLDDDASLFQDDDGAVYFLFGGYHIARMKDDMSGLAEAPRDITFDKPPGWGEGIYMVKVKGKHLFINTGSPPITPGLKDPLPPGHTTYDCFSAVSTGSIYGPYTPRYRAIPHDGHNNLFQGKKGRWWATYFGSDPWAPFAVGASGRPAVLPVTIAPDGTIRAARTTPRPFWRWVSHLPSSDWTNPGYNDHAWKTGGGAFGDAQVTQNGNVTDVGTAWTGGGLWLRRTFLYHGGALLNHSLYLRHSGPVEVFLNGNLAAHLDGASDDYLTVPLPAALSLRPGFNTIAVHAIAGSGLAYIDVGLVDLPKPPGDVPRR